MESGCGEIGLQRKYRCPEAVELTGCAVRLVLRSPIVQGNRIPFAGQGCGKCLTQPVSSARHKRQRLGRHAEVLPQNPGEAGADYLRKKFETKNQMLAGRSASRRMKYGYQCVPNGT